MRSKDLLMGAAIDPINKIIMVSGGIDVNAHTIVLRVDVPEPGEYTVIKAEVNLTDEPWLAWQITLGDGTRLPTDNPATLILARQFKRTKYLTHSNSILFYDGEVRPGDAIFKIARFEITKPKMILSHNRSGISDLEIPDDILDEGKRKDKKEYSPHLEFPDVLERFYERIQVHGFGYTRPKIEVDAAVRIVKPDEIDMASFTAKLGTGGDVSRQFEH